MGSRILFASRRRTLFVSAAIALVLVVPTLVSALVARVDLMSGERHLLQAKVHLKEFDLASAEVDLDRAGASFQRAEGIVDSPFNSGGLIVPVVSENLSTVRAMVDASQEVVAAGRSAASVLETFPRQEGRLVAPWSEGAVNLGPLRELDSEARLVRTRLETAVTAMSKTSGDFLVPQLSRARKRFNSELFAARDQARAAAGAAFLIPRMLGEDNPRRWIVGAENNAELRGRGGYVGSFGTLEAVEGHLELGDFTPVADLPPLSPDLRSDRDVPREYVRHYAEIGGLDAWPNLFMSPNFPSGASLFARQLESQAAISSDGVISVDPIGLSYLMEVTGPVTVEGFPEPLTSENVVEWSLSRLYSDLEQDQAARREQSSKIAEGVWRQLTTSSSLDSLKLSDAVGRAFRERRMVVWSKDPEEQREIEKLGIGGTLSDASGDYLMLVSQNFGENKLDYYLERELQVTGRIRSDGTLLAETKVRVMNRAPLGVDLPGTVAGERPRLDLASGTLRSFMTLFVPRNAVLTEVWRDGEPTDDFQNSLELGRRRFAVYSEVPPEGTQEFRFRYLVPDVLDEDGYRLTVQTQSTVRPDRLNVNLDLPRGARHSPTGARRIEWTETIEADRTLRAPIDRTIPLRLAGVLTQIGAPWVSAVLGLGILLTVMGVILGLKRVKQAHHSDTG